MAAIRSAKNVPSVLAESRKYALVALAGVAELFAATGEAEQAWDLATLVVNHHVSWRETKEKVRAVLEGIKGPLPVESQVEFGEQDGTSNVWGEVDHLLSEL